MYLKNDNIIVGLLKNLIKKNTFYHSEGFKVFDDYFFEFELDVSGFDEELITKGLEELCSKPIWYKIKQAEVLSSEINNPSYNLADEKVKFHILKQNLIKFRDLTLKEK
ncbi:hypothetical protein [Gelidibacter mesophilus]|uniref:hypothetical protein n=1 Tax=Gelidibacter mesophilus TaxID=169050 RepID=UPI0003FEC094|nr:hypothetical protein [Gelidibacter mesophilus]